MGILDWFKASKKSIPEQEIQKKMENAVIPQHAKKKETIPSQPAEPPKHKGLPRATRQKIILFPSEKNVFFVENSFKLPPTFILNGYTRSGTVWKTMTAKFEKDEMSIKGIQTEYKSVTKLPQGERGSIELTAPLGLEIPDNTEIEFIYRTGKRKAKKRKQKRTAKQVREAAKQTEVTKPPKPPLGPNPVSAGELETMSSEILQQENEAPGKNR